jgi:hypothetical protein
MVRKTRRNRQSGGNTDAFIVKKHEHNLVRIVYYDSIDALLKEYDRRTYTKKEVYGNTRIEIKYDIRNKDTITEHTAIFKNNGTSNAYALKQWQQSNVVTISDDDVESIEQILKSNNNEIDTYLFMEGPSKTKPVPTYASAASALGSKVGSVASGAANAIKNRVASGVASMTRTFIGTVTNDEIIQKYLNHDLSPEDNASNITDTIVGNIRKEHTQRTNRSFNKSVPRLDALIVRVQEEAFQEYIKKKVDEYKKEHS